MDRSRAEAVCSDATADYRPAVERADVDAVVVSTPPNLHAEVAIAALEAGKHVLCEKPLAPNLEECRAVLAASSSAQRVIATGFNHRFFPNVQFVRHVISGGQIGALRHLRAYAGHPGQSEFRSDWEHSAEVIGGGTLMDNGIHLIDLVRFLGGEFDEAVGELEPGADAEANAFGFLRANDGRIAELASSWSEWRGYRFHVDAYGERGMVRAYYGPLLAVVATDKKSWRVFPAANLRDKLFGWQATAADAIFRSQSADFNAMALTLGKSLALVFVILLGVSTVVAVSLSRTITSAIHDLHVGTRLVDQGDFSHRIAERGSSQLTELTRSFNSMTASIERLIEDSKERERLEAELSIAQEVQAQLFPRSAPQLNRFEILGVCRPARSVSGDFYDYVQLSDTRVAVSFGDVSGKGISAALVMAAVHSTIRTQLVGLDHLADQDAFRGTVASLVAETNRQLCASTAADKFSTLLFGIYDAPTGAFTYTNAGHLPPMIVRGSETHELDVSGMVVGAFLEPLYESSSLRLQSGDLFAAFTDGVTEPENPYDQEFGETRLAELLVREADRPLDEIIRTVMDEVDDWTDSPELQDDMTMLLARRL